uniref:Uncharacterized protein n=1 Tax=Solanum lycopersicum TaxID=4081 RepID=A0A3Q7FRI0_SOLLC
MTTIIVHRSSKTTYSLHLPKEKDSNNLEWANKPPKSISVEMSLAMFRQGQDSKLNNCTIKKHILENNTLPVNSKLEQSLPILNSENHQNPKFEDD